THTWAVPGRYVLVSVTDTGCGMSPETQSRAFEPFFTTKEVGKGTGLGLSTVFGIVKQHDGHINVYSEQGKGTIFKVYLPTIERKASEVTRRVAGPVVGGTETLLIAEDDETVLALARHLLTDAGYTVLTAGNGEEAIRVFKEHAAEIDAVMFDVVMPRLGGKQALDKILQLRPGLPHLFVSGYSENAVHTNFIQKRGLHLLNKPYQAETLLRKIREVLDQA
ncbi:MAG TPA: response regulator, partial [Tichowtungia sp.]|nr:response regulator [Tichowtungia sp.]